MNAMRRLLLSATSALALGMLAVSSSSSARAADVAPSCVSGFAGTIGAGYILGDIDITDNFFDDDDDDNNNPDYGTFFGEGAALYDWCDTGLNLQGDFAFHSHQFDGDDFFSGKGSDGDLANDRWHVGGILFWRDEATGVLGIDGSFISDDFFGENSDSWRIGLRGEFFAGEMFTVGGGVGYNDGDFFGKNWDGFDANIWGRLYATDNIGLLARFDWAEQEFSGVSTQTDTWAIAGEGEFLVPEHPLSVFAGIRYAEQELDAGKFSTDLDHLQIYAGLKVYFGSDGLSLASHQRSNTLDNTSVTFERLPNPFIGKGPAP